MKNNIETHSLCPYLEPSGGKLCLSFSRDPRNATVQEKSRFPFLVINESDPVSRLIEAQFVTDAGSEIKRVFVLLQNDEYFLPGDELWPVNNKDIDQWWQTAFSFYSGKNQNSSVIILADQISKDGGLSSLQPLFFCKPKQIFFHPPCPKCGFSLQQCYDDDLLAGLGLQPYSTSLKRYLFCHSCFGSEGKSDFYVFALESSDPPIVKDRWDLIREFGLLTEGKSHLGQFPCAECPSRHECWAADGLAVSRIVPFSFYPFFMLIFEAMSVNALDFLSLISGASFEDLERHLSNKQQLGRMSCLKALKRNGPVKAPFFFDSDERYFLEVLYLKLSFLGELVQSIFSGPDTYKYPGLGLSIEGIWVKLADQSALLPLFWNFKVKRIEIGRNASGTPSFPRLPPSYGLHCLGLVWFYALLVNDKQDVSRVYASLAQHLDKVSSVGESAPEDSLKEETGQSFLPENIFWNPEGKTVRKNWHSLWERSLDRGWSLLKANLHESPDWSRDEFRQSVENLREEVKKELFREKPGGDEKLEPSQDEAIRDILINLMDKWRLELEEKEESLEETVVISAKDSEILDKTLAIPTEDDEIQETVILSPEGFEKEEDIPETVVISPSDMNNVFPGAYEAVRSKDVYSTKKVGLVQEEPKGSEISETTEDKLEKDLMAETVIISPDKAGDKETPND